MNSSSQTEAQKRFLDEIRKMEVRGNWKTRLFRFGFALIFFELLTGIYLLVVSNWNAKGMMLLLGHIVFGFLVVIPCVMFSLRHAKYRKLWSATSFKLLGNVTAGLLYLSLVTGVYLTFVGITGHRMMWWTHNIGSFIAVIGALAYVVTVVRLAIDPLSDKARSFVLKMARNSVVVVSVLAAGGIVVWTLAGAFYRFSDSQAEVPGYGKPFGTQDAFFPGFLTTPTGGFYKRQQLTGSRTCGTSGCHSEILSQFEQSVHYRTPNFFLAKTIGNLWQQADEEKLFTRNDIAPIHNLRKLHAGRETFRFCATCHAPVALLSGDVMAGKPLPTFESHEGDSCILCHALDPVNVNNRGTLIIAAPPRTLFWDSTNPVLSYLYKTLIKTKPEFHKKAFAKGSHKTAEYCKTCHVTLQYTSWHAGPYADSKNPKTFKACQSCHMPQLPVADEVSGRVKGTVANHRFLAEGFTMAQAYGQHEQYRLTKEFLRDKKLALSIVAPKKISSKGTLHFAVRIANIGVGHSFPAGPEGDLAEGWVEVLVRDSAGKLIYQYGVPDKDGYLDDKKTEIYRILPYDADDKLLVIDRHSSWKFAKDVAYVIPPKEYDEVPFEVRLPAKFSGQQLNIETRLRYRKPNQQFMDWVFGKGKFMAPIEDITSTSFIAQIENDRSALAEARSAWLFELNNPIGFEGLKKKDRNLSPTISPRIALEDQITFSFVLGLIRKNDFKAAEALLDSLPELAKKTDPAKRLREMVKKATQ